MKSITLSKQSLIIFAVTAIVIALGIFALKVLLPGKPQFQPSPLSGEDTSAQNAAVNGVGAFFTVDFHEGKDAWLKRVCEISTTSGCQFIFQGADPLWEKINASQSVITAKVTPVEKVAGNASEQVWVAAITLSSPLPGSNKTKDQAYVAVGKTEEGWKFDRFLMPGEIQALQERGEKNGGQINEEKKQ